MISTKGRYAIRVLLDLAEQGGERFIPLKDIAERQGISKKYLKIIVKDLVTAGFLTGASGKGGGYVLSRRPEDYNIGEVLELMEGTLSPVICLAKEGFVCPRKGSCETLPLWQEYDKLQHDFFYGKRLSDLIPKE